MNKMSDEMIVDDLALPRVIEFEKGTDAEAFTSWCKDNWQAMGSHLLKSGALHIKGCRIDSVPKFDALVKNICPDPVKYLDANSPRGKHTSAVYNASEYDAHSIIRLHTEYSYSTVWPSMLVFCCIMPASEGGETTVGDTKSMLEKLNPDIVREFEEKGITYIRNMHSGKGFGPSWMDAFETNDRSAFEHYCKANDIRIEWKKDGSVRLVQWRPAIRLHPITKERLWFNQVDQFYPQIYGEEVFETMLMMAGGQVDDLPMYARFGDGTEIQRSSIDEIVTLLDELLVPVPWGKGDVLFVENMLALHGRLPFSGKREILVSMI